MQVDNLLRLLEEIKATASNGKTFTESKYDIDRYNQILNCINNLNRELFKIEADSELFPVADDGLYVTPKIGVNGLILDKEEKVLLEKRIDDGSWGIPGGWCEVGKSVEENLVKELKEETGYDVEIDRLIKVASRMPNQQLPNTSYHALYRVNIVAGSLNCSHESLEVAWLNPKEVDKWHADHGEWVKEYLKNEL